MFLFKQSIIETKTIKYGFNNSIGWKRGKTPKSSHLFDPFTSIPTNGTNKREANVKKKRINEILIKISSFKIERKNSIKAPNPIKIKCLIKK